MAKTKVYSQEQLDTALLIKEVQTLTSAVNTLKLSMDGFEKLFVTRDEFWPVRTIVYGGAGIILLGVLGALLALVVVNRPLV